ncbi:hypothetical protein ABFS82_06G145400 [Erythranthe guttata]
MKNMDKYDYCLLDSATTHSIFNNKIYFSSVTSCKAQVKTIAGSAEIIDGSGNATIVLPNGTTLHIENALISGRSNKNLLSFKDVGRNEYHLETQVENTVECLCVTSYVMDKRIVHEKFEATASGLYCVQIRAFESYATMPWKLVNPDIHGLWHDGLDHPGTTMMRRIAQHTK